MSSRRGGRKKASEDDQPAPAAASSTVDVAMKDEDEVDDSAAASPPKKGTKRGRASAKVEPDVKLEPDVKVESEPPTLARKSSRAPVAAAVDADGGKKSRSQRAKKKVESDFIHDDEDEEDEPEEDEDDDEEEEAPKKKRGSTKKSPAAKKKAKADDDEDAEEDEPADEDGSDEDDGPKKKKKAASPKKPRAPKAPKEPKPKKEKKVKPPKKPKGLYLAPLSATDDAAVLDAIHKVSDSMKAPSVSVDVSCCSRCSSRECFRAVHTNNLKLLENACDDFAHVSTAFLPWSADVDKTPLHFAILKGDRFLVRRLLHEMNLKHWSDAAKNTQYYNHFGMYNQNDSATDRSKPKAATDKEPAVRVSVPTNTLQKVSTGNVSNYSYNHRVAQLNLSRGGKEGNNAFVSDSVSESSANFLKYFNFLMAYGKNPDLIDVFAQTLDPVQTTYENAMKSLKPALPPSVSRGKSKAKEAAAAAAAALAAASKDAAGGDAVVNIHTREDEVVRSLTQMGSFHAAAEAGNLSMARAAYAWFIKRAGGAANGANDPRISGFNLQHQEAMNDKGKPFSEKFKSTSATKKGGQGNHSITPIHLAAINPDVQYLKELFETAGTQAALQTTDEYQRSAVHYAAACSSPEPLKYLISVGANIFQQDKQQNTPLTFAVKYGCAHNISLLVPQVSIGKSADKDDAKADDDEGDDDEDGPRKKKKVDKKASPSALIGATVPSSQSTINLKNKRTGVALFHTACELGNAPTVQAMLEAGADPFILDKEKRTGILLAAQQGHTDVLRVILDWLKAKYSANEKEYLAVQKKQFLAFDRQHRLPVFHAVKNGHFEATKFLLIEAGLPVDAMDSSDNNLVHYASAYGWTSILNLLLAFVKQAPVGSKVAGLAGAGNIWRTTPLFIAMLKSHIAPSSLVLSAPNVDVNVRDSDGKTILHHVVLSKTANAEQVERQLNFLIDEKGADVLLREPKQQRTVLHLLASLPRTEGHEAIDTSLAQLFLNKGVGINDADVDHLTPLLLALDSSNLPLVRFLLSQKARVNVSYGEKSRTPLMALLDQVRPETAEEKAHLAEKAKYEQEQENQKRWSYGRAYVEDPKKKAEQKEKNEAYLKKKKELDLEFEKDEKEALLQLMLDAGQKLSDVKNDPLHIFPKDGAAPVAKDEESKSDNEEDEDEEDEFDEEDEDEEDDDGPTSPKAKTRAAVTPLSPTAAASALSGAADLTPMTLHYLNASDASHSTLLMKCLSSLRAQQFLELIFRHSASFAAGAIGSGYEMDLMTRDSNGKTLLYHAAACPENNVQLVSAILKYAQQLSNNAPVAPGGRKGKAAGGSSSSPPSKDILDLNSVMENGQTLLSAILSLGTTASPNSIAPIRSLLLIEELVNVGGYDLATAEPVITMHRKADAPPNPPPVDPAHPDRVPVKFEFDVEEIRSSKLLTQDHKPIDCEIDDAHYQLLRKELPHYEVEKQSFFAFLLSTYFRWATTKVEKRPLERVVRQEAAFMQIINLTLERIAAAGPEIINSVLLEKSYALPHRNVLHQIFAQAKQVNIKPVVELLVRHLPADLLKNAGNELDKDGCVPLLVLGNTVLPIPQPVVKSDDKPIEPQPRSQLKDLLAVNLHLPKEDDDSDKPWEDASAKKEETEEKKEQEAVGAGLFAPNSFAFGAPASSNMDEGDDEDAGEDEDEDEDMEGSGGEDEENEDDENEDEDMEAEEEKKEAASSSETAPAKGAPKLAVRFIHTAGDVTDLIQLFVSATKLTIDAPIQKKWYDVAQLKKKDALGATTRTADRKGRGAAASAPAAPAAAAQAAPPKQRPRCQYWEKCYRKNPAHFAEFLHPADLKTSNPLAPPAASVTAPVAAPSAASSSSLAPATSSTLVRALSSFAIGASMIANPWGIDEAAYFIPEQKNLAQTLLHLAVYHRATAVVEFLVKKLSANVMAKDYLSRIPLMLACVRATQEPSIPATLLAVRAEDQVLAQDLTGAHPLSLCAQNSNKLAIIKLLLQHATGKQIALKDKYERTAIHYSVNYSARRHGDEGASGYEEAFAFESALIAAGADVNAVDADGRVPLHYVFVPVGSVYAEQQRGKTTDPIELVSDICAITPKHAAAVSPAKPAGKPDFGRAQSFIHKLQGVECFVQVDVKDKWGRTPILYAAANGAQIACKYLAQRGASFKTVDLESNGIFQHALSYLHMSLAVELMGNAEIDLTHPIHSYTQHFEQNHQTLVSQGDLVGATKLLQTIQQLKLETVSTFCFVLRQNWIGLAFLMLDTAVFSIAAGVKDALDNNLLSLVWTLLKKTPPAKLQEIEAATGRNLFHIIAEYNPSNDAARTAFADTWSKKWTELLVDAQVDCNAQERVFGYTPLHFCAIGNHVGLARYLLTEQKVQNDVVGYDGFTPLLLAARHNNFDMLKLLIEVDKNICKNAKAKGTAQAKDGTTLLHWAAVHENFQLANFLLKSNAADINPVLDTIIDKFDLKWHERAPGPLPLRASSTGAASASSSAEAELKASETLRHRREKFSNANRFKFPFSWAEGNARYKNPVSPLQVLLTPLHSAKTNWDLVKLFLAYGADPNLLVLDWGSLDNEDLNKRGETVLMNAVTEENDRLVALLTHEADPVEVEAKANFEANPSLPKPVPSVFSQAGAPTNKQFPMNFNLSDSQGQTIIHRVVIPLGAGDPSYEDVELLKQLVTSSRSGKNQPVNLEAKDAQGHTPLYYAYQQASGRVSQALIELGAKPDARQGEVLVKSVLSEAARKFAVNWDARPSIDAAADSAIVEAQEEKRLEDAANDDSNQAKLPPAAVDKYAGNLKGTCIVYKDNNGVTYDLEMTFTEVNAGPYGKHAFYVMQVLINPLQNLPILFTRFGRVGEEGQHQQTPFSTVELAVAEFEKIFKSKSGNNWQTNRTHKTFVRLDNKYHLVFKKTVDASKSLLASIETIAARANPAPPASTTETHVQELVKLLCDVSRINESIREMGYSSDDAVAMKLTRSVLESGYEKLKKISALIPTLEKLDSQLKTQMTLKHQTEYQIEARQREAREKALAAGSASMNDDDQEMKHNDDESDEKDSDGKDELKPIEAAITQLQKERNEVDNEISKLSNEFFQLVPQPGHRASAIRAITDKSSVQKYVSQFLQFLDLHVTKKLLIGCQLNLQKMHPIDYCYYGLGISISSLNKSEKEYGWISDYVYATGQTKQSLEIYNIFRLNRAGEDARFEPFAKMSNRTLLWHGSGIVNFNGILSQGLRIAPPEADVSGYAFGKGVYFADSFQKSYGYCRDFQGSFGFVGNQPTNTNSFGYNNYNNNNNNQTRSKQNETPYQKSKCLLLCEVALGKSYPASVSEYMETTKPGFDSTKAIGSSAPDPRKSITTLDGVVIPNSKFVKVPVPKDWKPSGPPPAAQTYHCTGNNEFIIYNEGQCRMRFMVQVGAPRPEYLKQLKLEAEKKAARAQLEKEKRETWN